ncbi:hypothetical protein OTU49_017064 [Cherax quadricarinatus]|uniref:Uncharacterized protein n=1 Tax=Cherax quadricarinatus TaxID=27406 RepID=A0AAW0XPL2_CHEQU
MHTTPHTHMHAPMYVCIFPLSPHFTPYPNSSPPPSLSPHFTPYPNSPPPPSLSPLISLHLNTILLPACTLYLSFLAFNVQITYVQLRVYYNILKFLKNVKLVKMLEER